MSLIYVIEVVLGIGFLIFIHELGHFVAAKLMGVRVLKFSLGFGKRLVGFRRGETEYTVNALLLGGYVKMVGENPGEQQTPDPHALSNQSARRRAIIFVAGALMNAVGGLVLFIVAFQIGVPFPVNKVGEVTAGPAFKAGIREGDEIVEINGRSTPDFEDVQAIIALSNPNRELHLRVRRAGQVLPFTMRPQIEDEANPGYPTIGVAPERSTVVGAVRPGSAAAEAGLSPGDQILAIAVDHEPEVPVATYHELQPILQRAEDKPVVLTIKGRRGLVWHEEVRQRAVTVQALPWDVGRPTIQAVVGGSPAEAAGLQADDVLLQAGDTPVTSDRSLIDATAASGEQPMQITVRRGQETKVLMVTPRALQPNGVPKIGVAPGVPAGAVPEILAVKPGTALARMDLPIGSVIQQVNETQVANVGEVRTALYGVLRKQPPKLPASVRFTLRTPAGQVVQKALTTEPVLLGYELGIAPEILSTSAPVRDVVQACVKGWQKTVTNTRRILLTIGRMVFTRSVKGRTLAGPLGIATMAYTQAKSGLGHFLYLLAILGVNLAVVNLLPIPILDGGQLLLLGIEKAKGSPISERSQAYVQYVGLFLILTLFAYVMFQDVNRLVQ